MATFDFSGSQRIFSELSNHSKYPNMNICSYNIMHGGNSRLNQALRCMRLMGMDLGVLTETKLVDGTYTREAEGYEVVATEAKSNHQGGVALFYRKTSENWVIEGTRPFGPNVIRATLVSGKKRWIIIGAYIPPSEEDGRTLDFIQEAAKFDSRYPLILLGDFNVELQQMMNGTERQQETAALISSLGLHDLHRHFSQRHGWKNWTWSQMRDGNRITSVCDYILVDNREDFECFQIKNPRYDSDHRLVKGVMRLQSTTEHHRYMKKRSKYPIVIPPDKHSPADKIFEELSEAIEKPERKEDDRLKSWISPESWKLIDMKADARRIGNLDLVKELKKRVRRGLKKDRQVRTDKVAEAIEDLLLDDQVKKAYGTLQGWYKDVSGRAPKPTFRDEAATRTEYEKLFTEEEPPGEPIPIHINIRQEVDDGPPSEEEVVTALKKLKLNKAPGASGIRVEDLRSWWYKARKAKEMDPKSIELWEKVLALVKLAFTTGETPQAFCNGILVLIPKSVPGQYRGIALLEIIYKLVSSIINRRLERSIQFHDAIHGFRAGRGTGTAIIEAKLLIQLAQRSTKPLHMVFLDLSKAYDTLDRQRTLEILEGYGVGANLRRILSTIWESDTMVPKQSGYYGKPFRASRGVRQGDIVSPMIFNIIVDAVVRDWEVRMGNNRGERRETKSQFYADDGLLSGEDPKEVQHGLDILTDGFARVGLKMNATKTEAMTIRGGKAIHRISDKAYIRRLTGTGMTHKEHSLQKMQCNHCGQIVSRQYLTKHQKTTKCQNSVPPMEETPNSVEDELHNLSQPEEEECEPMEYEISMPGEEEIECPVEGCVFSSPRPGTMRKHFRSRHPVDTITVEEEGPLPRCTKCGLFQRCVGTKHQATADCMKAAATLVRRQDAKEQKKAEAVVFTVNGYQIKNVREFKYLGRILDNHDNDLPAVEQNLRKARQKWGRIGRILSKESAKPRVMASFYKAIIQSVLLYGAESWVISQRTLSKLRSFHRRCARYITGMHIRENSDGSWTCPSSEETLVAAGLWTVEEYIRRRRSTVMTYAIERSIYRRCLASKPIASNVNQLVWWNIN
jgi:exonuclease III